MEYIPGFGFVTEDQLRSKKTQLWKSALLAVLLEADRSSTIFVGGLAYLENKILHSLDPDLCLLVGDINDSDLFGFKHTEYIERRLALYKSAMRCQEVKDIAAFRSLGIITLIPEEYMSKVSNQLVESGKLDMRLLEMKPQQLASMVSFIDFQMLKPLQHFDSTKERLLAELETQEQGDTNTILDKLATQVANHLQTGVCRLFVKDNLQELRVTLELKEYTKAANSIITLLKSKMPLDKMSELLHLVIELLKGLKETSQICATEMMAKKSLESFELIKHRFLDYAIEKGHLQSSLFFLGRLYAEGDDRQTGLNIIMSGFLLVPESVSDLSFRRRSFKYLLHKSDKLAPKQVMQQIAHYIDDNVSEDQSSDDLRVKVGKMVIDWIEDRLMRQKYQNSNKEVFSESLKAETIRPSISHALDHLLKVMNGQKPPSEESFPDLESAIQDIFKPKTFFSKVAAKSLSGLVQGEESATQIEAKEIPLTVQTVRREIAADPKLRLLTKEQLDVKGTVSGLETFEYNGCSIYKGWFHQNQQKVTIFEVDYGDLFTTSIFKSVLCYLKLFHQNALCFYGVIVESGESPQSIKIYYVAEHIDWFLSRASATHIEGLSDAYKASVCTDILQCLSSFHAVGIPFCQLNPDLVAFSSGKPKLIFPFFLNSRLFFTNHYLGTRLTDELMFPTLLFIKPEILRKPELLLGGGVSPFRKDFVSKFGPNMNGDLYSFTLIVAYIHMPRFFTRPEFSPPSTVQNYLTKIFTNSMRGAWAEELFEAANLVKLRSILTAIYKEPILPINTFGLLAMVTSAWEGFSTRVTPITTKRSFVEGLTFNSSQPVTSFAYFPCGIVADWPDEDPALARVYLQKNLLMLGPFWSAQDGDSYQLELFPDDLESIKFEINRGSVSKAKIIIKEQRADQLVQKAKIQLDNFCANTFLPRRSVLEALINPLRTVDTPRSKDPLHAGLMSIRNFLSAGEKLCGDQTSAHCVLDPFGNQIWTTLSESEFPELSTAFFVEAYAPQNLSKSIIVIQDKHPGRWMTTRVGTFGLGEALEPWTKYIDLIRDFDSANLAASMVLTPSGHVYNGSLHLGCPARGVLIDPSKPGTTELEAADYSEQEVALSNGLIYRGEIARDTLNGEGMLIRQSKSVYQGTFKDGLPHGKGKIYSAIDEQTAFTGYFKHGRPLYGMVIGKKRSACGWILSPPTGLGGGLIFSSHQSGLNSWLNGFATETHTLGLFAIQTPDFTFEEMAMGDKLSIAPNALYEGTIDQGSPNGRGVLLLHDIGTIHGVFSPKISHKEAATSFQVIGNFLPHNKQISSEQLIGVFSVDAITPNGNIGISGYCRSESGEMSGNLKTECLQTGSLFTYWDMLSFQQGCGRRDVNNQRWVGLVRLEEQGTPISVWELWTENEEEILVSSSLSKINIQELSHFNSEDCEVIGKFKHLSHKTYSLSGPLEISTASHQFKLGMINGKLFGSMKAKDGNFNFEGEFDDAIQPLTGRLETLSPHLIAEGHFVQLQIQGEGKLRHPSESVTIEGNFAVGRKHGLAIASVKDQKTMVCNYHEDVRHGYALRYWPHARQLLQFNYGDMSVVFEVEESK